MLDTKTIGRHTYTLAYYGNDVYYISRSRNSGNGNIVTNYAGEAFTIEDAYKLFNRLGGIPSPESIERTFTNSAPEPPTSNKPRVKFVIKNRSPEHGI